MHKEKYFEKVHELCVNASNNKVVSTLTKDTRRTGIRIYNNNCIGVAGTIGNCKESDLDNMAIDSLKFKIPYPYEISKDHIETQTYDDEYLVEEDLEKEVNYLISEFKRENQTLNFSDRVSIIKRYFRLTNDNNLDLEYSDVLYKFDLGFLNKDSLGVIDGSISYLGRKYDRNIFLKWGLEICNAYMNKVQMPRVKSIPILFHTSKLEPLEKIIENLDGQAVGTGVSIFCDKFNKKIFNENFTLYHDLNPKNGISPFFDFEGVVNNGYAYTLIENGIMRTAYTDKRTAANYNLPLTGNAGGQYDDVPYLMFIGCKLKCSNKTAKELLDGELGILVIDFTSEFNSNNEFVGTIQTSYLFDGHKLIGRLPGFIVKSNLYKMFGKDYIGVSKETKMSLSYENYLIMRMEIAD